MSAAVFGASVSWYDATPLGRIFNRFSSDIITLDKDLMNDVSSYSDMVTIPVFLDWLPSLVIYPPLPNFSFDLETAIYFLGNPPLYFPCFCNVFFFMFTVGPLLAGTLY